MSNPERHSHTYSYAQAAEYLDIFIKSHALNSFLLNCVVSSQLFEEEKEKSSNPKTRPSLSITGGKNNHTIKLLVNIPTCPATAAFDILAFARSHGRRLQKRYSQSQRTISTLTLLLSLAAWVVARSRQTPRLGRRCYSYDWKQLWFSCWIYN